MISVLERLESKMNWVYPLVFLVIFIIMLTIINGKSVGVAKFEQMTQGVGILDMQPGYSAEKAYEILDQQGDQGRDYYLKRIIPMDFIFPVTYMLFYSSLILYLLKIMHPRSEWLHYVALIPAFAAGLDFLENLTIIRLLVDYPERHIVTAKIANACTVSKTVLIYSCQGIIVALLLTNLIIWLIRPKANV